MNILSISFAFMGIIILTVSLAGLHPALEECEKSWALRPTESSFYHYHFHVQRSPCSAPQAVLTVSIYEVCIENVWFWKIMIFCLSFEIFHSVLLEILGKGQG